MALVRALRGTLVTDNAAQELKIILDTKTPLSARADCCVTGHLSLYSGLSPGAAYRSERDFRRLFYVGTSGLRGRTRLSGR
jgi:hypothetical protein